MRRRLESRGAESHLWPVLLAAPVPVAQPARETPPAPGTSSAPRTPPGEDG
jgi:hypothetical protein